MDKRLVCVGSLLLLAIFVESNSEKFDLHDTNTVKRSGVVPVHGTDDLVTSDYTFNISFTDSYTLFWKLDLSTNILNLAIQCTGCSGWVAFGPSPQSLMFPSDIMIGYIDDSGNAVVSDLMTSARDASCPGLCNDTQIGGTYDFLTYGGNNKNGNVVIIWSRLLDTGDSVGDFIINNTNTPVVWGYNPTTGYPFQQHNVGTRGPAYINFFTGATEVVASVQNLYLAHGALMFISWSVIVPIASFVARYLKKYSWWFNFHRVANGTGIFLAIISFVIAVAMVTVHFDTYHKIIGLIVTILGTAQPIIGMLADHFFNPDRTSTPIWPDKIHWVIGWGTLILAVINVFFGLQTYGASNGVDIAYIIYAVVLGAFLLLWFIFRLLKPSGGH